MLFYLDIENKERFKVKNTKLDFEIKELMKAVKRGEKGVCFDIKRLGIVVVDDVIIDIQQRSAVFKTHLRLDYREYKPEETLPNVPDVAWYEEDGSLWHSMLI